MEEIKIQIDCLESDMQSLENKIDDFSRYGRSPTEADRLEQIDLFENWLQLRQQLKVCKELLEAILNNNQIWPT